MKKGTLIILLVVSFVLSIALAVVITWLILRPTQTTPPETVPTPTIPEPISSEPELVVPDNWEPFASVEYEVEFSYPPEWGVVSADLLTGLGDSLYEFPELAMSFGDGVPVFRSIRIASLDDLSATNGVSDADAALQQVYKDKDVSALAGVDELATPPVNAGLYAHTDPVYIQNPSGTFRGFYAYTLHVQNDPGFVGSNQLTELLLQLTDGETVVQAHILIDPFEDVNFTAAASCNVSTLISGVPDTCAIPRQLNLDQQNLLLFTTSLKKLTSL